MCSSDLLSVHDLGNAMRVRSAVVVPVGAALRTAAWIGLVLAAATAYARPWVVRWLANVDQVVADWALFFLDRGEPLTVAAGITTCIGFVAMVFTNGGFRAEQFGMFGLGVTAVAGTALGAPTLVALIIGVLYLTVVIALGAFLLVLLVGGIVGLANGD